MGSGDHPTHLSQGCALGGPDLEMIGGEGSRLVSLGAMKTSVWKQDALGVLQGSYRRNGKLTARK